MSSRSTDLALDLDDGTRQLDTDVATQVVAPTKLSSGPADPSLSGASIFERYPFATNIVISSTKTAAADLFAQVVIAQTTVDQIDCEA